MTIEIYHNPKCSKSRNVLKIVQAAGYQPEIIAYQKAGWAVDQLQALFSAAGLSPREALRARQAKDVGLGTDATDAQVLEAMVAHPVLVERPLVKTPKGVRLCRPETRVLEILEHWPKGPHALENGTVIIDKTGALAS